MPPYPAPVLSAALLILRGARKWSSEALARAARAAKSTISRYENGKMPLDGARLLALAGLMGYTPEQVTAVCALLLFLMPDAGEREDAAHPLAPGARERRDLAASGLALLLAWAPELQNALEKGWTRRKIADDRKLAASVVATLERLDQEARRSRVEGDPDCRCWAVVPALGERSVRSLGHSVAEGEGWAALARLAAERAEVPESWRPRLRASAHFFSANVLRVGNRLRESDAAFAQAWALWRENPVAELPLEEWRYLNLEASLRSDQRRSDEAVMLLEQCMVLAPEEAVPRLRLKLGCFLNEMGEHARAVPVLQAVHDAIEREADGRLCCTLNFNLAFSLLELGRAEEALPFANGAQDLARDGLGLLDILRADALVGRVAAALGQAAKAQLVFAEVRRSFTTLELALDAALVALEEALALLQVGADAAVRELAGEIYWIFRSGQLKGESLAALKVFYVAARKERATAELIRQTAQALAQGAVTDGTQSTS